MSKKWCFHEPGNLHALDFFFETPVSEAEARDYMRWWLQVKRLPQGSEVWRG